MRWNWQLLWAGRNIRVPVLALTQNEGPPFCCSRRPGDVNLLPRNGLCMPHPSPPRSTSYLGAGELTIVHASRQKSVCPLRWKDTIFLAASFTCLSIPSRPAVFCGTGLRFLTEKPVLPVSLRGHEDRTALRRPSICSLRPCGRSTCRSGSPTSPGSRGRFRPAAPHASRPVGTACRGFCGRVCVGPRPPRDEPAVHRTANESDRLGYAVQGDPHLAMDGGMQDRPCLGVLFPVPHLLQIPQADAGKEPVPTPYPFCMRHEGRRGSGDLNPSVSSRIGLGLRTHLSGSLIKILCGLVNQRLLLTAVQAT